MNNPTHMLLRLLLGICCLLLIDASPGSGLAGPYEVHQGDTLKSIAAANNIPVKQLAQANGLAPNARIKSGLVLEIPNTPSLLRQDITVPGANLKALEQAAQPGYSKVEPPQTAASGQKAKRAVPLAPEFRPAVDAVTPTAKVSNVAREPKTYDRSAPGISAVLHQDDRTEIRGVFNLPGGTHPSGHSEHEAGSSTSAGVLLRHSF